MTTISKNHRRSFIGFALLGFVSAFALPSVGNANTPASNEVTPTAATDTDDDDDCPPPKSTIVLEVDVSTGFVYIVGDTGMLTILTNNELDAYVGALDPVLVDIQYSSGEWLVEVSASGGSTQSYKTRGGALRYWMDTDSVEYLFSATPLAAMTMMNMTPVEPDIVIRPTKDCPPTT
jgi:hypothetical protein